MRHRLAQFQREGGESAGHYHEKYQTSKCLRK
jgi:hypothetical protein